jgi:hypothetical protein
MKNHALNVFAVLATLAISILTPHMARAQGTAFTYQGQLQNNGSPATGTYNLQFLLYTGSSGGTSVAGPVIEYGVPVTNGLFTVTIDFGSGVWNGETNWLEIAVEGNDDGGFTTLAPRQQLTPEPCALYAESAGALPGLSVQLNGGNGPNVIGGSSLNYVPGGVEGATIGGGGATYYYVSPFFGTIYSNSVLNSFGTVSGGGQNIASGLFATVGGGVDNTASGDGAIVGGGGYDGTYIYGNQATGGASFVGGGYGNSAFDYYTTVGGGYENSANGAGSFVGGGGYDGTGFSSSNGNHANGDGSVIGGGLGNTAGGQDAFIGGGTQNSASAQYATIGGGQQNTNNGTATTVSGGYLNAALFFGATAGGGEQNCASNNFATVPGGRGCIAGGVCSFAAGQKAVADSAGSFVWGDGSRTASDQGADTFNVVATGGIYLSTTASGSSAVLDNSGDLDFGTTTRQMLNLYSSTYAIGVQNNDEYFRTAGQFYWYEGGLYNSGNGSNGGGTTLMELTSSGLTVNGDFVNASDRNMKKNFRMINPAEVLERVSKLPITRWDYKQDAATDHIGPMAQDFYAAFNVGPDNRHITTIDEGGVALAAIQGLDQKVESENATLRSENAALKKQNDSLAERLDELEQTVKTLAARN